jgi:hypothetical protein
MFDKEICLWTIVSTIIMALAIWGLVDLIGVIIK